MPLYSSNCGLGTTCWTSSDSTNEVLQNATGIDETFSNGMARDGQLTLFANGQTIIRFTSPNSYLYSVSAFFQGSALNPSDTENLVLLLSDGIGIAKDNLPAPLQFGATRLFQQNLVLYEGDELNFFVLGVGNTATGFNVQLTPISPVPLPPAWLLMLSGLVGLGLVGQRRAARGPTSLQSLN